MRGRVVDGIGEDMAGRVESRERVFDERVRVEEERGWIS